MTNHQPALPLSKRPGFVPLTPEGHLPEALVHELAPRLARLLVRHVKSNTPTQAEKEGVPCAG